MSGRFVPQRRTRGTQLTSTSSRPGFRGFLRLAVLFTLLAASFTVMQPPAAASTVTVLGSDSAPVLIGCIFCDGQGRFLPPGRNGVVYGGFIPVVHGGSEASAATPESAGTLRNLTIRRSAASSGFFWNFVVRVNSANTTPVIGCNLGANQISCTDSAHSVVINNGDTVDLFIGYSTGGFILFDPGDFSVKWSVELVSAVTPTDPPITASGTTISATEGIAFNGTVATFTDPDTAATAGEYSATIDWGDSSATSTGTVTGSGGSFTVSGSHLYAEEKSTPYTVTVTITDTDNASNTAKATSTANVADAKLAASCATPPASAQSFSGKVATFTDQNPGATTSDFTATINWGDGSTSTGAVNGLTGGPFTVSGSHTYSSTGTFTIATTIKDDGGQTATTSCNVLIFAFAPGRGGFAIGDREMANGTGVTFWGAQWSKKNPLSTGGAPDSFKGYAENPAAPSCGATWNTDPGNSTPPPNGPLPAYMGVIVTSTVTKSGAAISGDTPHIVVVKTDPGYAPDPGHAGTGTVVQQVC